MASCKYNETLVLWEFIKFEEKLILTSTQYLRMIEIHKNKPIPSHAVTYIAVWHEGWNENADAAVSLLWGRDM
jgi:hypothetical protein